MNQDRSITVGEVFRYTKPNATDHLSHPYRSFWSLQSPSQATLQLESGINAPREVQGPDGPRMPILALRSSPLKAGTVLTPWHDEFDIEAGKVRYFGDHRVEKPQELGETTGDARLERAWSSHRSASSDVRMDAPPILVFRTVTGRTTSGPVAKGFVEFVGLAVMTDLRPIEQRDPQTSRHFMNYVTDLTLLDLGQDERLDWTWIDARRDPTLTSREALARAPQAWKAWVRLGPTTLPSHTRLSTLLGAPTDGAEPPVRHIDESLTSDADRLPFPWVAARAVEQLLGVDRTRMMPGIEREGAVVFRGTHRLGSGAASAALRVVAVAAISGRDGLNVATSTLRELEPGQIGVLVTPAALTDEEIRSIRRPGTPLLVLSGETYRARVLAIAEQSFDGDLNRLDGGFFAAERHQG